MKLDNRLWILISSVLILVLIAGGWFLGVGPFLAAAAVADEAREGIESQNRDLRVQIASLAQQEADLPKLADELEELEKAIPAGVDGSEFIASVTKLASQSDVTLTTIALTDPVAYVPPAAPAPPAPAAEGEAAEGAEAAPAPAPAAGAGPVPLTDPLVTTANMVIVPIEIGVSGSNDKVMAFLERLQEGDRLVLVTKIAGGRAEGSDASSGSYAMTITGSMYVMRDPAAELAAAAPETEG